jgi:hypothetical protein
MFMKIRPLGAVLFRRNTTKVIVAFRNFMNAPKKILLKYTTIIINCFKLNVRVLTGIEHCDL